MKNKFKVGDIVTCKRKYSDGYTITKHGVMCEVIDDDCGLIYHNDVMEVRVLSNVPEKGRTFIVDKFYFKLWKEQSNKSYLTKEQIDFIRNGYYQHLFEGLPQIIPEIIRHDYCDWLVNAVKHNFMFGKSAI